MLTNDRKLPRLEVTQGFFSLPLKTVAMDRCGRQAFVAQEGSQEVGVLLGLDENHRSVSAYLLKDLDQLVALCEPEREKYYFLNT